VKVTAVVLVAPVAVALTVAVSVWAVEPVHVSTEVPPAGMETVVTLSEQDALPVDFTERVTVLENPPRDATVIVEVPPGEPTLVVTLVGLALMSIPPDTPTLTGITTVSGGMLVEVPFTRTVTLKAVVTLEGTVMVRPAWPVEPAVKANVVVLKLVVGPEIEGVAYRFTVPANEPNEVTPITELPLLPGVIVRLDGTAATVNAGIVNLIVTNGASGPEAEGPVAVTTTL
jgi:hypothetical protein